MCWTPGIRKSYSQYCYIDVGNSATMLGVLKADATRTRQVVEFTVSSVANYAWVLRYHASFVDSTGRIVFDMSAFGFEAHHSG